MRTGAALSFGAIFAAAAAGCTLPLVGDVTPAITPSQRALAEQRNRDAIAAEEATRAAMDTIIVLPGDSSRPYRVLGVVRPDLNIEPCDPDRVREAAIARFGKVDAIIGYTHTAGALFDTSTCEGTAVLFLPSPPPQ